MSASLTKSDRRVIRSLVVRAQRGNKRAFAKLYDRYAGFVYGYLLKHSGHKETAEDLLSITFLKVWEGLDTYELRKEARFSTWVIQIARNSLIDEQRRRSRQSVVVSDLTVLAETVPDIRPTPVEAVSASMETDRIRKTLVTLPEPQRQVLELRFYAGLTVTETAQELQKTPGSVRVMQHRAIVALRAALAEQDTAVRSTSN